MVKKIDSISSFYKDLTVFLTNNKCNDDVIKVSTKRIPKFILVGILSFLCYPSLKRVMSP